MDRQKLWCRQTTEYCSEEITDTNSNVDESRRHYVEQKQQDKRGHTVHTVHTYILVIPVQEVQEYSASVLDYCSNNTQAVIAYKGHRFIASGT